MYLLRALLFRQHCCEFAQRDLIHHSPARANRAQVNAADSEFLNEFPPFVADRSFRNQIHHADYEPINSASRHHPRFDRFPNSRTDFRFGKPLAVAILHDRSGGGLWHRCCSVLTSVETDDHPAVVINIGHVADEVGGRQRCPRIAQREVLMIV